MHVFDENRRFLSHSAKPGVRSVVENDRLPSFQGAPDGWECPALTPLGWAMFA